MNPNIEIPVKKASNNPYSSLIKEGWEKTTHNCHYAFYTSGGDKRQHFADVCFAKFHSASGIKQGAMFINQHEKASTYSNNSDYIKRPEFRKLLKEYIQWVVRKSPFRFAFLNGSKNFFKLGLWWNCNVPHKYVFGACTAIREGWEFPWRVEMWDKLVKAGVSPELSYYVMGLCSKENTLNPGYGHSVMTTSPSGKGFQWFKTLSPDSFVGMKPMSTTADSIHGVSALFTNGPFTFKSPKRPFGDCLMEDLKPFCIKSGIGYNVRYKLDPSHEPLITFLKGIDNA
jgi:hypothetical protein